MTADILKRDFELRKENIKLKEENDFLKKQNRKLTTELSYANARIKQLEKQFEDYKAKEEERTKQIAEETARKVAEKLIKEYEKKLAEKDAYIKELERRLNLDSTNSSIPTSKERIGTHNIQNNREETDKEKGGQRGHKQHKLKPFKEEEITKKVEHKLDKCPLCGGSLTQISVVVCDVVEIAIKVEKIRNNVNKYKCESCHKIVTANDEIPRGTTYGSSVNALAVSMMNEANTPLNKVSSVIQGLTNGEINLSEGYLAKLQRKTANKLDEFIRDLNNKIITLDYLFWDDTVVKFGMGKPAEGYDEKEEEYLKNIPEDKKVTKREGVIRFYGDDNWALLIGHRNKDTDSYKDDGIFSVLPPSCTVMHDHLLCNYKPEYKFKNAECNQHICRYLKDNMKRFPEHQWSKELRDLLLKTNKERNELIKENITNFSDEKIRKIFDEYSKIIEKGYEENKKVDLSRIFAKNEENNLVERLDKFKENHLLFVKDFNVAFTNNTSERGLRQVKRKLAVSFMFDNANRMKDYATLLSYLETCYRNGIARYNAAKRLLEGNPYTVAEIEKIIEEKSEKIS